MTSPDYAFLRSAGRILNSGQARTVVLTGNVYDLFCHSSADGSQDYVTLLDFLSAQWKLPNVILVVYEINGPIRFVNVADRDKVKDAWLKWRTGLDANEIAIKRMLSNSKEAIEHEALGAAFDANLKAAVGNPTVALELFRQMCLCSRSESNGAPLLKEDLLILIESADMLLPEGEITRLSDVDRHRVNICHDWFGDPGFMNGHDAVVLLSESRSLLNSRVSRLPQVLEVSVPSPDESARLHFINWFLASRSETGPLQLWSSPEDLARFTAGLSIHALMQLMKGAQHERKTLTQEQVIEKVEDYIKGQLGEDIVEFKKPSHTLNDVVGFTKLKRFLREELIPRFRATGPEALSGAAVAGAIGGGKTFIFEAVASELDMVVLVLKNIRSQWFGQTDVIFERLRRVLDALAKVLIFVDEADTQFGAIGPEAHETERRLTGKIQAMMSDPKSRGRVVWLLMTARIHLLSPDLRRPGRVGDLIIPVLDPEGDDRTEFVKWLVSGCMEGTLDDSSLQRLDAATLGYSAASFASMRSELKAKAALKQKPLTIDDALAVLHDHVPPAIGETRRYQTLQALVNCTRRSLLPDPQVAESQRAKWAEEIRALEMAGVR
ncbi:MAG: ATP-binding protein [Candidatus Hydrogenedentes bacterium]|nr:ATP-binding protein [Candidatus Hydrogenedentota bacterium]